MRRPIVIIESPYRGDTEVNLAYARRAVRDCIERGESPFASHVLYTQPGILDDDIPSERSRGMKAALEFYRIADLCAVYTDLGYSAGMWQGIAKAKMEGVRVEYRTIRHWSVLSAKEMK